MEPKQNPLSENEWSIEEREEFFAGQDAMTGLFSNMVANNGTIPKPTGIHVTHIVPPDQGWPIAMHCPICKETTFIWSLWAIKPKDGDYWRMTETCARSNQHNIELAMNPFAYRPLPGGYMDATVPHRGSPPSINAFSLHSIMMFDPYDAVIEQEMPIEEAKRRFSNTLIGGQEKP